MRVAWQWAIAHFGTPSLRGVAQLVAFLVWDQAVAGSSPVTSTITALHSNRSFPYNGGFHLQDEFRH